MTLIGISGSPSPDPRTTALVQLALDLLGAHPGSLIEERNLPAEALVQARFRAPVIVAARTALAAAEEELHGVDQWGEKNPAEVAKVLGQVGEHLRVERGLTAVLVTHDIHEALTLADRVVRLEHGQVAESFVVDLPRPRQPEAPGLAALEQRMVQRVLGENAV